MNFLLEGYEMSRIISGLRVPRVVSSFIFTRRCALSWVNRENKDLHQDKTENFPSENKDNSFPRKNSTFFTSEIKELGKAEALSTTPTPAA
jgi:hypothetical protein